MANRASPASRPVIDDRWRPPVRRPDVHGVDPDRIAGEGPDQRQLVDDAPEHDVRVQRAELAARPARARRPEADPPRRGAPRSSRQRCRSGAAAGGHGRAAARWSGGGRRPRSSGPARPAPCPRRPPRLRRPRGRTASCSRPGACRAGRRQGGRRSHRPRRGSRRAASRRTRQARDRAPPGPPRHASPRSGSAARRAPGRRAARRAT